MPEELLSVLTRFHREVVVPDIERIVDAKLDAKITPFREEMLASFDAVFKRLDRLTAAVRGVELKQRVRNGSPISKLSSESHCSW